MLRSILLSLTAIAVCASPAVATPAIHVSSSHDGVNILEGTGPVTISLSRTIGPGEEGVTSTVKYETQSYPDRRTASVSGTVTFGPGQKTASPIVVPILNDQYWSGYGQTRIRFYDPVNARLALNNGTESFVHINITDDDPLPFVRVENATVQEGDSGTTNVQVTVRFTPSAANGANWFYFSTSFSGSAKPDLDYVPLVDHQVFVPSQTSTITFNVAIKGDTAAETNEQFTIVPRVENRYYPGVLTPGSVTIVDDDAELTGQNVADPGAKLDLRLRLKRKVPTAQTIAVSTLDPSRLVVPATVDVPPNTDMVLIPVQPLAAGATSVIAKLPAAFGGVTLQHNIQVITRAMPRFDPDHLSFPWNEKRQVRISIDPPQPDGVEVGLTASPNLVAPRFVNVPPGGAATIEVSSKKEGTSTLTASLATIYGGSTHTLTVQGLPGAPIPTATTISPKSGPSAGGTPFSFDGTFLTADCAVLFGGVPATNVKFVSATRLTGTTPPHRAGATDVTVACRDRRSTLPGEFRFDHVAPALTGITPTFGSIDGGTLVRVEGTNLLSSCGVLFEGVPAKQVRFESATSLVVTTPAHAAGRVAVTLRCPSGESALAFTYSNATEPLVSITGLSPADAAPGELVTLTGLRFRTDDRIRVGFSWATVVKAAPESLTFRLPMTASGATSIDLFDAFGRSVTTGPILNVRVAATPQIASVTPLVAAAGTELRITGSGFHRDLVYRIGDTPLTLIEIEPALAVVRLPWGASQGAQPLRVGAATGPDITVTSTALAVTRIDPPCADGESITALRLTGSGFAANTRVTINGAEAAVRFESASSIVVQAPGGAVGPARIVLENPGGGSTTSLTKVFRYTSAHQPSTACGRTRSVR